MPAEGALRDGNGAGFELIETLRWEPAAGFVRLERHLARLYASATELDFAYDPQEVGETLGDAVGGAASPLRVRLDAVAQRRRGWSRRSLTSRSPPTRYGQLRIAADTA